jgi:hypothetical protein
MVPEDDLASRHYLSRIKLKTGRFKNVENTKHHSSNSTFQAILQTMHMQIAITKHYTQSILSNHRKSCSPSPTQAPILN